MNRDSTLYTVVIVILGIVFFFPFLGKAHLFDWDEINFAESAREMIVTGNYSRVQIDFKPFWEKPPLFFWMQALSMHIFGINEYAARFPNAVFGVLTLVTLFNIGRYLYNERFGLIWALAYLGSFLPHLYFKSGIIDPVFNYFIFLAIFYMIKAVDRHSARLPAAKQAIASGIFIGLAILTKGPVGLLIMLLTFVVFWISERFRSVVKFKDILLCALFAILISLAWFGWEVYQNGIWFMEEFITYQIRLFSTPDAGHGQPFYYHAVVLLIGCFPISVFALRAFVYKDKLDREPMFFRKWMIILFWVVLILFSIVTTKIVHYSSMAYFPLSFLAAYHLYYVLETRLMLNRFTFIMLAILGSLWGILLTLVPIVGMNTEKITPYIKDDFAVGNLQADVHWSGAEIIIGLLYLAAIIFALRFFRTRREWTATGLLFMATAMCMLIYTAVVVPKIERYTQAAAVRFYQSLQGEDVYVHVIGFKSYAHLFYFNKPPVTNEKSYDEQWLLTGEIDKPAYFVSKVDRAHHYRQYPELKEIKTENGFVFFKREN